MTEEKPTLRNRLMKRSKEIRACVLDELTNLKAPVSITDLVRRTHSNRVSIARIVTEILTDNKLPISLVKIGNADVLYRTDIVGLQDTKLSEETRGE